MSELGDIESAVIGLIEAVQVNSVDLFAEVKGFSNTAPRDVVAGLRRELKPAAYVVYDGRVSSDPFGVPADPKLSVFAIVESLRGGDEPRAGSALQSGGFDVLGELFTALAGSTIVTDRQLAFVDEHLIAANDTSVIYEQRYSVLKLATITAPTFGGSVISKWRRSGSRFPASTVNSNTHWACRLERSHGRDNFAPPRIQP